MKFFKKYHKWLGLLLTAIIILFSLSGVVMNHREFFSGVDVSRDLLADNYHYNNWNNGSVKGTVKISKDSILIYGNSGIWLTDSSWSSYSNFTKGLPDGIDNKKISKLLIDSKGDLFAGTLFGLFRCDRGDETWYKVELPVEECRIVDIIEEESRVILLTRSSLLTSNLDCTKFIIKDLPKAEGSSSKVSLFKTLWMIHSGELFGLAGKLFVDILGIALIVLSITGLIFFINPYLIRRRKRTAKSIEVLKRSTKWNLKWHNKIGWITALSLTILTITGMFLRPPLLIPISNKLVDKIPYSTLDSDNPWFDKFRAVAYDSKEEIYILATSDGVYYTDRNFSRSPKRFPSQPPSSVMGVNVFQLVSDHEMLVGSFAGLYLWNYATGAVTDYIDGELYRQPASMGRPIGNRVVSGYSSDIECGEVYFDYYGGMGSIGRQGKINPNVNTQSTTRTTTPAMPLEIGSQPISLWNLALEIHTARIYESFLGIFYILLIPLFGLSILFVLISGFIVWLKKYKKK